MLSIWNAMQLQTKLFHTSEEKDALLDMSAVKKRERENFFKIL
jgi:hypothetical protein